MSDPQKESPAQLAESSVDRAVRLIRIGLSGIPIPGVSAALSEIVTYVVPNQRIDRVVAFLRKLDERLSKLEAEQRDDAFGSPTFVQLLECGIAQAAEPVSDERRAHIATLVANGLAPDALSAVQQETLLRLLGELNEAEVVILVGYALDGSERAMYERKHWQVMVGPQATMASPPEVVDRNIIHDTYREHLIDLGLLRRTFSRPRHSDELPKIDYHTGMVMEGRSEISPLGRLLVRQLGLFPDSAEL